MITLFSTPKAFKGHFDVIQRNAIRSWTLLHPEVQVILIGSEPGIEAAAADCAVRHVPDVESNEYRTPLIRSLFERAQQLAAHDVLCYVNCDTLLLGDFATAVRRAVKLKPRFLLVGRRWGLRIDERLDFGSRWETELRAQLAARGVLGESSAIEYFCFTRGLWRAIPPLVVGRPGWDNWMLREARHLRVPLIDASAVVTAIHQDHDYSHHAGGWDGVWRGEEAKRNVELMGDGFTTDDATHVLTVDKLRFNADREHLWRHLHTLPILYPLLRTPMQMLWRALEVSRPLRSALGLRTPSPRKHVQSDDADSKRPT
jgi:hypothetical protein